MGTSEEKMFGIAPIWFAATLFVASNIDAAIRWTPGVVHEPRYFRLGQQSLLIDGSGDAHAFYGGNHLYHARNQNGQWLIEVVDNAPRTGANVAAAIDSAGRFHVVYSDGWVNETRYATNISGSWVIEKFPSSPPGLLPFPPPRGSVAVDGSGRVHFVYYEGQQIMYAQRDQSGWQKTAIDNAPGPTLSNVPSVSIALDAAGRCHVSYWFSTSSYESFLKYATNASGTWSSEIVDPRGSTGSGYQHSSIALDATGRPHVAYQGPDYLIYFASRAASGWSVELVDSTSLGGTANAGRFASLGIDGNGKAYIAHVASSSSPSAQIVRLSTNVTGQWTTESLATLDFFSEGTSLRLGVLGSVHILYQNSADASLHRAIKTSSGTSADVVDRGDVSSANSGPTEHPQPVGLAASLFVDSDGSIHTTYLSGYPDNISEPFTPSGRLLYATNKGGTWRHEAITGVFGDGSPYQSIERSAVSVDRQGIVHVAFRTSSGEVVYGNNRSGTWALEQLDLAYSFGPNPLKVAIALDRDGFAHVTYFAADPISQPQSARLRYGTNRSGAWAVQTVTSVVAVLDLGLQSDLSAAVAIGDDNKVYLAFLGGDGGVWSGEYSGGAWRMTNIGVAEAYSWVDPSMVIQPGGIVHMAFVVRYGGTIGGTGYATNRSGEWIAELADEDLSSGITFYPEIRALSLAVAPSGTPHLTYDYLLWNGSSLAEQQLRHARRPGYLWRVTAIESIPRVGNDVRIGIAPNGLPVAVYADIRNGSLKFATSARIPSPEIDVAVEPDDLDFGEVPEGSVARRTVTIFNRGEQTLTVPSITVEKGFGEGTFMLDMNAGAQPCRRMPPLDLVPGDYCTFDLTFESAPDDDSTAFFLIESNDPELPSIGVEATGSGPASESDVEEEPPVATVPRNKSGGCSLAPGSSFDPVIPAVFLLWSLALLWRRKAGRANPG